MGGFKFLLLGGAAVVAYMMVGLWSAIPLGILALVQFAPGIGKFFGILFMIGGVISFFTLGFMPALFIGGGGLIAFAPLD